MQVYSSLPRNFRSMDKNGRMWLRSSHYLYNACIEVAILYDILYSIYIRRIKQHPLNLPQSLTHLHLLDLFRLMLFITVLDLLIFDATIITFIKMMVFDLRSLYLLHLCRLRLHYANYFHHLC